MKLYDLSPVLQPGIAEWPGDEPFSHSSTLRIADGAAVNLSFMTLSLHTGSHADAPLHYDDQGASIDELDLTVFLGSARLVNIEANDVISPEQLADALADRPQRLLVRCNPGFRPDRFPDSFVHFTPEAAEAIGRAGVRLVGLDAPSVDNAESKELPCHHAFHRHGTLILENLLLDGVPEGEYQLVALPLRIASGDASPVRAVLISRN